MEKQSQDVKDIEFDKWFENVQKEPLTTKEKILDQFDDFKMFLKDIRLAVLGFFIGMGNFWYYRELIYRDRWYDHDFLIKFITVKLKQMEENWHNCHYMGSDFTKKRMQIIRKGLETFEEEIDNMVYKKVTEIPQEYSDEERKEARKEIRKESRRIEDKVFSRLGRNIRRFWD